MTKKKTKKTNIIIYLIVLVCVFGMFMATSYAYFKKTSKEEDKKIIYNDLLMSLNFDGKDQISIVNIKPGFEDEINFSINNFSEDTIGKYKIIFEIITPLSNMIEEKFTYTLEGISNSKDNLNKVINDSGIVPCVSKELDGGIITPKNIHSYKIKLNLDKSLDVKKYPKGSMFSAKIKLITDNN